MTFVPKSLRQLSDHLVYMALAAPAYRAPDGSPSSPEIEFRRTRGALEGLKGKLGEREFAYLMNRVEENWRRLMSGDVKNLKLSFGEMAHLVRRRPTALVSEFCQHSHVKFDI